MPSTSEFSAPRLPLFVFGSLMDPDLLSVVLGGAPDHLDREPARLAGYRRHRAEGEVFPVLVEDAAGRGWVDGLLLHGLTDGDLARILYYEGAEYAPHIVTVTAAPRERRRRCRSRAFLSTGVLRDSGEPWELASWQSEEKPVALRLASELMTRFAAGMAAPTPDEWDGMKARCRVRPRGRPDRAAPARAGWAV